ncbi:MAG: hypothetical protein JST26_05745 [Bacteroidetes bacterium]|nr:hypothetical protein [Bacteroidota bacterium]
MLTAKEIIRIYGISLLKVNSFQEINPDNLPTLQTNNQQLAGFVKCSPRSIQRHIQKLQAAGIITKKIFHGSNANYELLITPKILLVKERLCVNKAKKQLEETLEKARQNEQLAGELILQTSNCPHTYTGNTSKKNNIIIPVDNGNGTGDTGEIVEAIGQKKDFKKNLEEAGEIVPRAGRSTGGEAVTDTARGNSLNMHVSLLWLMARNLLYKNTDLTERQISIAKQLIHKLYEPLPTEHFSKAHQQYVARISLVEKYIRKDPTRRFVTLPYLYFDVTNPKGFVGTKKWYQDDMKHKAEVQRELTVNRLIRSYITNEKKEACKRKPKLQLFRQCENTIGKFNDPALLNRFHAAVLDHETYSQITYIN